MINSRLALCFIAKCCACIPSIRDVTVGYEVTTVLFFMFCSVRHRCLPVQYKIKSQSKKCASCKLTEEAKAINTIGLGQTGMGFCLYFVARKGSEVLRQYITQWLLRVVQWKKTTVDSEKSLRCHWSVMSRMWASCSEMKVFLDKWAEENTLAYISHRVE